ncbi:MAG: MBL fold metallo-hydrolase [Chloroflexi bacterium]|nr:MBL fold metallo-hydrolase [Chloroflexota bacterium]
MSEELAVTLLGTGSPRPTLERSGPSQLVHVGDEMFLVDCGDGATTQLLRARLDPSRVTKLLFTHLHTDHTLGYGQFVIGGWTSGRRALSVWGPKGLARLTDGLFKDLYKEDIEYRLTLGVGRTSAGLWDIDVHEIGPGLVIEDGGYSISATEVEHSIYTLAYRFESGGRALVIGGDTVYCLGLVNLARGADVLVQDCTVSPHLGPIPSQLQSRMESLSRHHATPRSAGRMAREAGVRKIVLTHLLADIDSDRVAREVAEEFDGEVVIGEDLMRIGCW